MTDTMRGHFPGISSFALAVSSARQDITASFTEHSFEATAASRVEFRAGGGPPIQPDSIMVDFDRPCGFVARQPSTGLILCAGWIADVEEFRYHPDQIVTITPRPSA